MKKLSFTLLISVFALSGNSSEFSVVTCPLPAEKRLRLIKEVRYPVDDLRCVDGVYLWTISNRRFMRKYQGVEFPMPYEALDRPPKATLQEVPMMARREAQRPVMAPQRERPTVHQGAASSPRLRSRSSSTPQSEGAASSNQQRPIARSGPRPIERPAQVRKQRTTETREASRALSFVPGLNEWNTAATFGGKYLALSQEGSLLKAADVDVTFFNRAALTSEFLFENWGAWMGFSTYKFRYATLNQEDESSFNSFELGGSWKWLVVELESDEVPLFKNDGGNILMTKMNVFTIGLGVKEDFEFPSLSSTFLRLKGTIQYPVRSGTNDTKVKIDSFSGFGVKGNAILTREIFRRVNYSVLLTWTVDASYQQFSPETTWGNDKGGADTSITSIASGLGLVFSLR